MARIRILGAGVAGLVLAAFLDPTRHEVELVDERFEAPAVSTAFALWPGTRRELARRGLEAGLRERGVELGDGVIRTADGVDVPMHVREPALMVPRTALVEALDAAVPASVVRRRARVDDPVAEPDVDVLVGADGVGSRTREAVWGARARVVRHGCTVFRGVVDLPGPSGATETWGRGWLMGVTPLDGVRTNWFACVPERRFADVDEGLRHLRDVVGGHRADLDRVLDASRAEATLVHGIRSVPRPWRPVHGHVVLVGDAAHAMTPNLGRGACTAIDDAVALAALLDRHAPREALRRYSRRRVVEPHAVRIASAAMLRIATADRRSGARDALLAAAARRAPRPAPSPTPGATSGP